MDNATSGVSPKELEEIRALGRWSRRYVQSRTIPVLVGLAVFGALMTAMLVLWPAAGRAYRSGDTFALLACAAGLVVAHAALVWLCVPRWGGRQLERWAWRYYNREGVAAPREPMPRDKMRLVGGIVACIFGACVLLHVALGLNGIVSEEMALPLSALYLVPFMAFIFVATRTYVMLLLPVLYAAHATIIAAGLPDPLSSVIPLELRPFVSLMIYGIVAVAVSHVYNRIALSRMAHYGRVES